VLAENSLLAEDENLGLKSRSRLEQRPDQVVSVNWWKST